MSLNSIYCLLAQAEIDLTPPLVSTEYQMDMKTLCGVLLLLFFGIGIGIWVAYRGIKIANKRRISHHHHHHSHHHHSKSEKKTETTSSDDNAKSTTETSPANDVFAHDKDAKNDKNNEEGADDENRPHHHHHHHRRRVQVREHRPRLKTLSEADGLPEKRPEGVPPPTTFDYDV